MNISPLTLKKADKRMYFVRRLRNLKIDNKIICLFYNSIVSSILVYAVYHAGLIHVTSLRKRKCVSSPQEWAKQQVLITLKTHKKYHLQSVIPHVKNHWRSNPSFVPICNYPSTRSTECYAAKPTASTNHSYHQPLNSSTLSSNGTFRHVLYVTSNCNLVML